MFLPQVEITMNRDIFQLSLYGVTFVGLLDGIMELSRIKEHGNFGIGAVEGLEGELTFVEGEFYHADQNGNTHKAYLYSKSPKMTVTEFIAEDNITIEKRVNFSDLKKELMKGFLCSNYFYALKIKANFDWIKLMSYPKQIKPYPSIDKIARNKKIDTIYKTEGYMIGFYTPVSLEDLCGPSWHFHFLDMERNLGGHIIDCSLSNISVQYQYKNCLNIQLPDNQEFHKCNLHGVKEQLEKIVSSFND